MYRKVFDKLGKTDFSENWRSFNRTESNNNAFSDSCWKLDVIKEQVARLQKSECSN